MLFRKVVFGVVIATCTFMGSAEAARRPKWQRKAEPPPAKAQVTEALPFTLQLPKGWQCLHDRDQLPATVELVYVGKGKGQFTPSVNLATEATELPQGEYLALARKFHESQLDTKCNGLGSINTEEGEASLLQIDRESEWGTVRFIQAALVKEGIAYVITATCLVEEYPTLSAQFLQAIQSFTINEKIATREESTTPG